MKKYLFLIPTFFLFTISAIAQDYTVEIEDELQNNRLLIFAVNKNLVDLDVAITVEGTGFRQRAGVPRKVRVPATSRVNLTSLVVERGKQAMYTYTLDVSDSLSRRVIKKEFELIKIDPKKPITLFLPDLCTVKCDTIINPLNRSPYNYKAIKVSEDENVKKQLSGALVGGSQRLDTLTSPIVMLGGKMYLQIESYDDMMSKLNEEE